MILLLLFLIILIYLYEYWKMIKIYPSYFKKSIENFIQTREEELNQRPKFGFIPHNIQDYSNNPIVAPTTTLNELKETDNKDKANYVILLRLEELRREIEVILERLIQDDNQDLRGNKMMTKRDFKILSNFRKRNQFLDLYLNEIPDKYLNLLEKRDILQFSQDEFRFLLRLLNNKEKLTNKGYSYLINSNLLRNLNTLKTIKKMKLVNDKFVVQEEIETNDINLVDVLTAPSVYSTSYLNLPNNVDPINFS